MPSRSGPAAEQGALRPERLFAGLAGARGCVAAVSGGPDSTALMALLAAWPDRPPVLVATVDHGLRPESRADTLLVQANAERLGLPCRILRAPARPESGNLQDWARRARYRLLAEAARGTGYDIIATAHHQDDQAETFLLRLARGSGVYGLGAMRKESSVEGVRLVRPLLEVPRATLAAIAAASGLVTADDPTNRDTRFDRVRMRDLLPILAEHGLDAPRLSGTAQRLRRAGDAIDHYARACLAEHFSVDLFGVVVGSAVALAALPEEVGLRSLALICQAAGGADYTPPLDRLERLYSILLQHPPSPQVRRTLHGATLTRAGGVLAAMREWGRGGPPVAPARAGCAVLWDRRFRVAVPENLSATHVGPVGSATRRLRSLEGRGLAYRTLPGLFRGQELLALPAGVEAADDGPTLEQFSADCLVGSRLGLTAPEPLRSP